MTSHRDELLDCFNLNGTGFSKNDVKCLVLQTDPFKARVAAFKTALRNEKNLERFTVIFVFMFD